MVLITSDPSHYTHSFPNENLNRKIRKDESMTVTQSTSKGKANGIKAKINLPQNDIDHRTTTTKMISQEDTDTFYDRFIKEAPYIPGDKVELTPASEIPWMNPTLLKQGVQFGLRNIFSLIMANTAALMYGFSVKPESVVLLRSGKFHTPEKSFMRYMSTAKRIQTWYASDITNEDSEGYKHIKAVRKLHTYYSKSKNEFPSLSEMGCTPEKVQLAKAIRDDMDYLDVSDVPWHLLTWDPPLQFSQFDVAMTQFGFIGIAYLYPKALGISDMAKMDAFLHFWAVIGRMMGLEDRFNLALHANKELFQRLYNKIGMASLKSTDETVICLQYSLIEGFRLPWLTLKGWVYYGLKEQGEQFKGKNVWKLMNFQDKVCYYFMKGTVYLVYNSIIFKFIANVCVAIILQFAYWFYLPKGCPLL